MPNWLDWLVKSLPATAPLLSLALSATQGTGRERRLMSHDADVAAKLPDGPAKEQVLALVEATARSLGDAPRSRNTTQLVLSLCFAVAAWCLMLWAMTWTHFIHYFFVAAFGLFAVVCTAMVFESARLIPRDESGNPLPLNRSSDTGS